MVYLKHDSEIFNTNFKMRTAISNLFRCHTGPNSVS